MASERSDFTFPGSRASRAEQGLTRWLTRYSVDVLRVSLGSIFLAFGALKFVPGLSPAEPLVVETLEILTLGLVPEGVGIIVVASLETTIGVLLVTGRWLRVAMVLMVAALAGILSPLVLLPEVMFQSLPGSPTLAGQYVLKDIVLAAAALVIGARAFGARMVVAETHRGRATEDPAS